MKTSARPLCLLLILAVLGPGQADFQGAPRGLGNLHNNATTAALNKVERLLPATKGQVQDVKADFEEYKNETTTLIDALVSEVNSLTPGYNGTNGLNGINGTSGVMGATGLTGSEGQTGGMGGKGSTGSTGLSGNSGLEGGTGLNGPKGATGFTGTTGLKGATGATGFSGATGFTGQSGGTGLSGATGLTGLQGTTGDSGATGLTGLTGLTGATGFTGSTGATGLTGCTGQGFTIFQLTTLGNNGPNGPTSVDGYATSPQPACLDLGTQLVQSGALAIVPAGSGVQRFTVPVTGTYKLDVNGAGSVSADSSAPQGGGAMVTGQIVLTQGTYLYTAIGQQAMRQDASALGGSGGTFIYSSTSPNGINDTSGNPTLLLVAAGSGGIIQSLDCGGHNVATQGFVMMGAVGAGGRTDGPNAGAAGTFNAGGAGGGGYQDIGGGGGGGLGNPATATITFLGGPAGSGGVNTAGGFGGGGGGGGFAPQEGRNSGIARAGGAGGGGGYGGGNGDAAYENQSNLQFCGAGGQNYADMASLIPGSPTYLNSNNAGSGSVTITLVN
ncbi:g7485 [Coccomyxa viridis]|uniref:G7485 protein n=1 Tax=Coccomyxa viridis TaxID=1274662 RepID=A0ABP1FXY1_9CHLO